MGAKLKWIANTFNPAHKSWEHSQILSSDETREQANVRMGRWLSDKIIGEPQATEQFTVEELKAKNIVGVYQETSEPE